MVAVEACSDDASDGAVDGAVEDGEGSIEDEEGAVEAIMARLRRQDGCVPLACLKKVQSFL